MPSGSGLSIAGDFGPAATMLVERVSELLGYRYVEAARMRRIAQAESDAEIIRAETAAKTAEIEHRAAARLAAEAIREQENIESIVKKAVEKIEEDKNKAVEQTRDIDEDWLCNFISKSKMYSNKEMQELWSVILSKEVSHSGSFSRKTVNIVSEMDKHDAEQFTNLCKFHFGGGIGHPIIFNYNDDFYQRLGIRFQSLLHLRDIGLINIHEGLGSYACEFNEEGLVEGYEIIKYGNAILRVKPDVTLNIGQVIFTRSGQEMARICTPARDISILEHTLRTWPDVEIVDSKI
jgi:hypothetical protein